jgi:predicted DNA-binding transcriptional regulator AlpA
MKLTPAQDTPRAEPHDNRPQYVRRREAARFLGLSYGTLSNWASAGRGPSFHRLGGRTVIYELSALHAFVAAGRVETSAA